MLVHFSFPNNKPRVNLILLFQLRPLLVVLQPRQVSQPQRHPDRPSQVLLRRLVHPHAAEQERQPCHLSRRHARPQGQDGRKEVGKFKRLKGEEKAAALCTFSVSGMRFPFATES
jgi:hypothetical protein